MEKNDKLQIGKKISDQYTTIGLPILIAFLQTYTNFKFKGNPKEYQINCEVHPDKSFIGMNVAELIEDLGKHIWENHKGEIIEI